MMWHKFSLLISRVANGLVVFFLCMMTVDILLGVFFRYVLVKPLPWAEDLGRYLLVWMALFGVGVVMQNGAHVAVTIVVDHLPARIRFGLQILSKVFVLGFALAMGYWSLHLLLTMMPQISPTLHIRMRWVYMGFPFYGFFLAVSTVDQILEDVRQFRGNQKIK